MLTRGWHRTLHWRCLRPFGSVRFSFLGLAFQNAGVPEAAFTHPPSQCLGGLASRRVEGQAGGTQNPVRGGRVLLRGLRGTCVHALNSGGSLGLIFLSLKRQLAMLKLVIIC